MSTNFTITEEDYGRPGVGDAREYGGPNATWIHAVLTGDDATYSAGGETLDFGTALGVNHVYEIIPEEATDGYVLYPHVDRTDDDYDPDSATAEVWVLAATSTEYSGNLSGINFRVRVLVD